jgi:hypothetical protein
VAKQAAKKRRRRPQRGQEEAAMRATPLRQAAHVASREADRGGGPAVRHRGVGQVRENVQRPSRGKGRKGERREGGGSEGEPAGRELHSSRTSVRVLRRQHRIGRSEQGARQDPSSDREDEQKRARGRSKAKAERGREGRAQTSTGREAFSRSIISQTTSREREPAHRAAGKSRRIRSHRR